jgi:endonuclease/exonuclease/phosphatase family metal-dependent hydrolase
LGAIGEALPGLEVDVAAFQEVWSASARASLIAAGARAGLEHVWHRPETARGSGLLLMSRHRLSRPRFEAYRLRGRPEMVQHADFYGGKGFVDATVGWEGHEVSIVTTHLHAAYRARAVDEYKAHRAGQVVEISGRVRDLATPVIAVGDFNFEPDHSEYDILTGLTGLRDAARSVGRMEDTVLAANPYRGKGDECGARIDYAFYRNSREISIAPRSVRRIFDGVFQIGERQLPYSDHAGLLIDFEISEGGSAAPVASDASIALARRLLAEGEREARRRRRSLRIAGGTGLAISSAGLVPVRRSSWSRRRLLRAALLGGGALVGGGCLALSEMFLPDELEGFNQAARRLDRMAR